MNRDDISADGNEIRIGDKSFLAEHPHPIKKYVIVDDDVIVVRFRYGVDDDIDRNIAAFASDGHRLWTVEQPDVPPAHDADPFVNIYVRDGQLRGVTYWGGDYRIDHETGTLDDKKDSR